MNAPYEQKLSTEFLQNMNSFDCNILALIAAYLETARHLSVHF